MCAAETFAIRHVTDVCFHIGSTVSEDEIHHMLLGFALHVAEWAFACIGDCV